MTWENDQQPPWGKKKPTTPEDFLILLLQKIKQAFDGSSSSPGGSSGGGEPPASTAVRIGRFGAIVLVVILLNIVYNSFYTIEPGERGVVLRFGKYRKTSTPGLNFMVPIIDQVKKVDVETVRKEEFGFRTKVPGQKTVYEKQGYDMESLVLTGDKNVIDVEWIVQYKVNDPIQFLFSVQNIPQAVRDVSEAAIRRVVGNRDFDYALSNRDVIEGEMTRELQGALDKYKSGVQIVTVKLQDVNPPEAVKPAFNEVNEADQDMKRLVNEAEETYNRLIPKARGDAKKAVEESQGYSVERVNLAKGETVRFLALLEEYRRAEDVTRRRLYLEALEHTLPLVKEIYVMDKEQQTLLPVLDLGKGAATRLPAAAERKGGGQ
ncbi:MAG: FtsH protease activity modulator HflK [Thermodesulfobacteriota bacterium]